MCGALRGAPRKKAVGQGADMPQVWQTRSHPAQLPRGSQSRFGAERRRRLILFGAVDQVRVVVGRDAAVGIAAVEAAVEIKQQRVEMPPL